MGIFRIDVDSNDKINAFREKHHIPDDVYIRLGPPLPPEATPIYDPQTQEMPFSLSSIVEGGVRFPLHPLLRQCLNFWQLAPTQLTQNAFKVIMGSLVLNELCNVSIGIAKIETCHLVAKVPHSNVRYYLRGQPGINGLVNNLDSTMKHTGGDFLWVSGNWEFGSSSNRQFPIPRDIGHRGSNFPIDAYFSLLLYFALLSLD